MEEAARKAASFILFLRGNGDGNVAHMARKSGTSTGLLPERIDASDSGRTDVHAMASYRSIGLLPVRTASTKSRSTNQSPPPWPVVLALSPSSFQYGCSYWSSYFSSGS